MPIGIVLLWLKISEKSPYSNNIFENAWDLPQIPHYVDLKFLVRPPFEHPFLTYVNLHLCKYDIPQEQKLLHIRCHFCNNLVLFY